MDVLRTDDDRFRDLPGWTYAPRYTHVGGVRIHYVDEGPTAAAPVLLLHGEPSWSFLYRKMIPVLVGAGNRVVAPDLVGFGRSDKPTRRDAYTYHAHVAWMAGVISSLDLRGMTLVCQDWGGLIGLRLVAESMDRFARVVAANTGLPTGDERVSDAFRTWQAFSQSVDELPVGATIRRGCAREMPDSVVKAYEAPFPDESYKAGARQFPLLVPTRPDDPASDANRRAWKALEGFRKPFLTAFGDSDPITRGADKAFQRRVPGCAGQPHVTIQRAGHFLQEDAGEELARITAAFIASTPA
jgi:haloalkane dehalogenase